MNAASWGFLFGCMSTVGYVLLAGWLTRRNAVKTATCGDCRWRGCNCCPRTLYPWRDPDEIQRAVPALPICMPGQFAFTCNRFEAKP